MGQNSGQLPAKAGSTYYLIGPAQIKMSTTNQLKIILSCKMIILFSILKQLPNIFMVNLWRLSCCAESYNHFKLQSFHRF